MSERGESSGIILDNYESSLHALHALWLETGDAKKSYLRPIVRHFERTRTLGDTLKALGLSEERQKLDTEVTKRFSEIHPDRHFDMYEVDDWINTQLAQLT